MKKALYSMLSVLFIATMLMACKTEVKAEAEAQEPEVAEVKEVTLYEKLGGAEGISKLVDDIVEEHLKNEHVAKFFAPLKEDPEHFETFKKHVRDFFGAGTGGSEAYEGRDMPGAHAGLNITEAEFMHAIDDIMAVMERHGIEKDARNEVHVILYSMKWAVIRQ